MMGVLLGLSWPPFPLPFLVFPAFLLLFRIIDLSSSAREAAYSAYPGFVIWNIITTYWLVMATFGGGVAAILANAAVMAVPVMLMYWVQNKLGNSWGTALVQTAIWISYEYLHHQWDLAWPWLAVGNAWANVPELVQYISATGYLGISFWVLLVSALIYQAIVCSHRKMGIAAGILGIAFPMISIIQLQVLNPGSSRSVEAVVVQPNFDSYLDYGGFQTPRQALDLLVNMSDSIKTDRTDVIVWPENGLEPYAASRPVNNSAANSIKPRLRAKSAQWDATIIGGTRYYEYFTPEDAPPLPRMNGKIPYLTYNAALAFQPDSSLNIYRKHNLVPIVERIPFVHFLNWIDVFGFVNWAENQQFGKGYDADQFNVKETKTPALICYDSVFPGWVREFVTDGAGFITIITNDGWWGDTSGHEQHFVYARLRALEFRRWIVRSANNGISGIIAPNGSVEVQTEYWTRTAFRYQVPVITESTIYSRFGDWLPVSMLVISIMGLLYGYMSSLISEKPIAS